MKKILIGLVGLIFIVIGYLFWYYTSSGDEEIHLLPDNFIGVVFIRFEMKEGFSERFENRKRVYEIPSNGVLDTKFKVNEGWRSQAEFYYVKGTNRTRIDTNKVQIYGQQIGESVSNVDNKKVTFISYIICPREKADSLYRVMEKIHISDYSETKKL